MPTTLPLVTRQEIAREYRPDANVTADSAIRALRSKGALSPGVAVVPRGSGGTLAGRIHLYSALNRDAARAARRRDLETAKRVAKAAEKVERSTEAKRIVAALSAGVPSSARSALASAALRVAAESAGVLVGPGLPAALSAAFGTGELARALSSPALATYVTRLQQRIARVRKDLNLAADWTVLNGWIVDLDESVATLRVGSGRILPVPANMLTDPELRTIGAAVSASWELLPGGRTLFSIEPAVDAPEVNELGEPLVDMYGTAWGKVLAGTDADALTVTGAATVRMRPGVPDVE